ncbi:MAG: PaaD-like zinc ribbon domain-containing protein, partial [Jatrophihabitans sp.]|uniref:PaaD-like zinc ribbon domain-containing protein n=1 Tax=Jatrophihabitans sp. TaxID=1932789 RepID=UPI003F7D8FDC
TALSPAWTTEWITETGRRTRAAASIPPPPPVPRRGPVALTLTPRPVTCPRCGSTDTAELARFSATACKSLHRCRGCAEPFEAVKPL